MAAGLRAQEAQTQSLQSMASSRITLRPDRASTWRSSSTSNYGQAATTCCCSVRRWRTASTTSTITYGFLRVELLHVLFDVLSLFWLGRMIEPALRHARFVAIYIVSLLGRSLGVMILADKAHARPRRDLPAARRGDRDQHATADQPFIHRPAHPRPDSCSRCRSRHLRSAATSAGWSVALVAAFVVEPLSMAARDSLRAAVAWCAVLGDRRGGRRRGDPAPGSVF